jgi:hypothetical protein
MSFGQNLFLAIVNDMFGAVSVWRTIAISAENTNAHDHRAFITSPTLYFAQSLLTCDRSSIGFLLLIAICWIRDAI